LLASLPSDKVNASTTCATSQNEDRPTIYRIKYWATYDPSVSAPAQPERCRSAGDLSLPICKASKFLLRARTCFVHCGNVRNPVFELVRPASASGSFPLRRDFFIKKPPTRRSSATSRPGLEEGHRVRGKICQAALVMVEERPHVDCRGLLPCTHETDPTRGVELDPRPTRQVSISW